MTHLLHIHMKGEKPIALSIRLASICMLLLNSCAIFDRREVPAVDLLYSPDSPNSTRGKKIETPKQLLIAVNTELERMNRPEFSMNELKVWIAEQARMAGFEEAYTQQLHSFLRSLVKNSRFEYPIELEVEYTDSIPLTNDPSSHQKLALPDHCSLFVHVLDMAKGTRDRDGNPLKVSGPMIVISYALLRKEMRNRR